MRSNSATEYVSMKNPLASPKTCGSMRKQSWRDVEIFVHAMPTLYRKNEKMRINPVRKML